jgi:hypothetical protein
MSNDLFDHAMHERLKSEAPLAARMRPRTLDEYIGQEHIVGEGKLLRRAIEADKLFSSIILWGPPGTGKTTLAQVIANTTKSHFTTISAILAGKADLRVVIDESLERRRLHNIRTILFVKQVLVTPTWMGRFLGFWAVLNNSCKEKAVNLCHPNTSNQTISIFLLHQFATYGIISA